MRRVIVVLTALYRRWKFVEEDAPAAPTAETADESDEAFRIRRAIGREEERIADCRRNGRAAMARERETTLRSLKSRLAALDLDRRRTA